MNNTIKVSVIIPVFNVKKYIGECLDSILNQTLRDIEIICVDDGSTDGSLDILNDYAARDSRMIVLQNSHAGAYKARATALAIAKGEFIYYMDSDDLLESCALQECCDLAEKNQLDHIVFTAETFTSEEDAEKLESLKNSFIKYYHLPDEVCDKVFSGRELMSKMQEAGRFFVSPPLRLMRMSTLKGVQYPLIDDIFCHGDNYYTVVSLYYSAKAMAVNRKYYKRRVHDSSITTSAGEILHFQGCITAFSALCRFKPFADGVGISDLESPEMWHLQNLFNQALKRGRSLSVAERLAAIDGIMPPLSDDLRIFLKAIVAPKDNLFGFNTAKEQCVYSIKKCAKYIINRLCQR